MRKDKVPINSKLPDSTVRTWHLFAINNKLNKEEALDELIRRGSKYNPKLKVTK
jgi:hypothetical protein